jgi:hypothetical protein
MEAIEDRRLIWTNSLPGNGQILKRWDEMMSAEMGTALNPFRSLPYIRMYGKVPGSFFLSCIGHIMAAIRPFVEFKPHRGS